MSVVFIVGIYAAITSLLFELVYKAQPTPFIDEIFHIPQSQKYCSGKFNEWDSKITTLPGMYFSSVIALSPFIAIKGSFACNTWTLRLLNVLFNCGSLVFVWYIVNVITFKEKMDANNNRMHGLLTSLVIATFPLLYFYSFLYYTDPSSTFMVLAAYYACAVNRHRAAAVIGLLSIIFRQSNVIWVVFMAGTIVARHLEEIKEINEISASPGLKDKLARFAAQLFAALLRYLLVVQNILEIIILIWPYLAVVASFGLFVFVNDGIVVGDRTSHQAVLHIPQLLYFSCFTLVFASPILITIDKLKRFWHTVQKKLLYVVIAAFFCVYVIIKYTHVHPYLLADNRHYVFYLWRWLLGKVFVRMLLVPVYIYSAWSINDSLRTNPHCTILWRLVFLVCVCAALVPQKLLEFRYFILPFVFFRVHVQKQSVKTLVLELILHVFINSFTVIVFLSKSFKWDDIEEPQRIIW